MLTVSSIVTMIVFPVIRNVTKVLTARELTPKFECVQVKREER